MIQQSTRSILENYWQRYCDSCQAYSCLQIQPHLTDLLYKIWIGSDFIAEWCIAHPDEFYTLIQQEKLQRTYTKSEYWNEVHKLVNQVSDEEQLMQQLRRYRYQEMVRIAWRDLSNMADLQTVLTELSALAESVIENCLERLYSWQCDKLGIPRNALGKRQRLLVIALGKLGGGELNFSSDVDLVFAYPEGGYANNTNNDIFFVRLAQQLIKVLHTTTTEGFVYRVDMRLRPFGDSGPLVMNFASLANYYQEQGRDWERYALVKARIITGDAESKASLQALLHPFVYRRYIDYSVIDALRHIKSLFEREERLKDTSNDIKRGSGGIRQIEFIAQTFQLIRGGQDPKLQQVSLMPALHYLTESGLLSQADVQTLLTAYSFLRRLEHRLQMQQDQQTHRLPDDEILKSRIAFVMDYADWSQMYQQLQKHREQVAILFANMMAQQTSSRQSQQQHELVVLQAIWKGESFDEQQLPATHEEMDWQNIQQLLAQLRESHRYRQLTEVARVRMQQLMPLILQALLTVENGEQTLSRIIDLLEAVMKRSVYLVLLVENPVALDRLVKLFAVSTDIAETITQHPMLLDELLYRDAQQLTSTPTELQNELRQSLLAIADDDLEEQMDVLRRFKQRQYLKIAIADVLHQLPLMIVSDHLTYIAEVILQQVHSLASKSLTLKILETTELAIIAYGKLGGVELSYQSDLDLVFLYDETITDERYASRLAQKIIHLLNTRTANGVLYMVDTRLRPSGSAGLLVSNFEAFAEYQQQNAWTWEHQALVRARVVSANKAFHQKFGEIRQQILARERPPHLLQAQVRDMRDKMRHAAVFSREVFDVKHSEGGITDIEFIVQYGVLAWSWQCPQLLRWTDNIHLLQDFATQKLMSDEDVELLCRAYQIYRDVVHQQVLKGEYQLFNLEFIKSYPNEVKRIWRKVIGE